MGYPNLLRKKNIFESSSKKKKREQFYHVELSALRLLLIASRRSLLSTVDPTQSDKTDKLYMFCETPETLVVIVLSYSVPGFVFFLYLHLYIYII